MFCLFHTVQHYILHLYPLFIHAAKKNLSELRQLYFKLKDRVFSEGRLGLAYSTASLEKVLQEEFGTEARMSDVRHPKYVQLS